MSQTILRAIVATICLATPLQAANILVVSDACIPESVTGVNCGTNQRDDTLVQILEGMGHAVDTSGMASAYRSNQEWWLDPDKVDAMDEADMILVSRRTDSGSHIGEIAIQAWNGLDTPLMLMSSFLTRDNRWGWQTGTNIDSPDNTETEMIVLDSDSPLVTGLEAESQVFDWTNDSLGGNNNPNPGQWPKNVTAPQIDSVSADAEVAGQFSDRAFLFLIPEGGEWSVPDIGNGSPGNGLFGSDRVFMGHWGYDIENYNFLDLVTGEFLTALGNSIDTLTNTTTGLECDFDDNSLCDVADVDLLLDNLGTDDPVYDLDEDGTVTLADRNVWLDLASVENSLDLVTGDSDLDGKVDSIDLNNLGVSWLSTDNPGWENGDFDGNDNVNALDLNDIGINWQHGVPAGAQSVPEPATATLLLLVLVVMGLVKRR